MWHSLLKGIEQVHLSVKKPPRQRGGRTLRWRGIERPLVTSRWYANTHKIQAHDLAREIIHYFRQVHENKDGLRKTPNIQSNIRFAQYRKIRTDGTLKLRVPKRQSLGGGVYCKHLENNSKWYYSTYYWSFYPLNAQNTDLLTHSSTDWCWPDIQQSQNISR